MFKEIVKKREKLKVENAYLKEKEKIKEILN